MRLEAGGTIKAIPGWFLRELEYIDPSYRVIYFDDYDYFQVYTVVKYVLENEEGIKKEHRCVPLATYTYLNDAALEDLRRRKQIGIRFQRTYNPDAYLNWIASMNRDAKAKARERAVEMMAEGFIKMEKVEKTKLYDIGAAYGSRSHQNSRP